jgi:hypothetical protein
MNNFPQETTNVAEHKEKWMAQRNPDEHAKTEYRSRNAQANGVQIQDTE